MNDRTTKRCLSCNILKPFTEFSQKKSRCKPCVAVEKRQRYHTDPQACERYKKAAYAWKRDHREEERIRLREWQRAKFRGDDVAWKRKRIEYQKRYRVYHTEYQRKYRQARQQTDPVYHKHLMSLAKRGWHRRRARIAKTGGTYTASEWHALCAKYDHRCLCCGKHRPLTVDHVIPLSLGGTNLIDNLQPLCLSCNSSKGTKTTDYRPHD